MCTHKYYVIFKSVIVPDIVIWSIPDVYNTVQLNISCNISLVWWKSKLIWLKCKCFFKVQLHWHTIFLHLYSGNQTFSLIKLPPPSLSFFAPSQLSVWRISCCSQPWDWIILLCCFAHPEEGNNEPAFLYSFIHTSDFNLSISKHPW